MAGHFLFIYNTDIIKNDPGGNEMAQIQIKNLTFIYPNQDKSAISDFNLDIR